MNHFGKDKNAVEGYFYNFWILYHQPLSYNKISNLFVVCFYHLDCKDALSSALKDHIFTSFFSFSFHFFYVSSLSVVTKRNIKEMSHTTLLLDYLLLIYDDLSPPPLTVLGYFFGFKEENNNGENISEGFNFIMQKYQP